MKNRLGQTKNNRNSGGMRYGGIRSDYSSAGNLSVVCTDKSRKIVGKMLQEEM